MLSLFSWHLIGNLLTDWYGTTHIKRRRLALLQLRQQCCGSILIQANPATHSSPSNSYFISVSVQFKYPPSSSSLNFIMKRLTMKTIAMTTVVLVAMAMAMALPAKATCSSDLSPYKVCMPAVLGDTPPLPTADCCKVIKVADIACLCTTVTHASLPSLNVEAALMLPKRCGVITPGTSTCATSGNPLGRKLMHF